MSRQPRQFGGSGYLHIIVRGIGKQILFEDRTDRVFFLTALKRFSREVDITVLAYCLMENHVHLLVHDVNEQTPLLMKKIGVSYSTYFNRKYERSGHLFQDRYLSEVVRDERSLLIVFRYILNNPQKAGLGPAFAYEWSSFSEYGDSNAFTDTSLLCSLIGDKKSYIRFLSSNQQDVCMEYEPYRRDDEWAKAIIRSCLKAESGTVLQQYDRLQRDDVLRTLKRKGLSVRQLERLTGINRGVIQKATKSVTLSNKNHL